MTGPPRTDGREPETWRGGLYSVVISGPGQLRWGIVVRASDADAARASVEARGHKVLAVREGVEKGPAATRTTLGDCIRCGYSLAQLPAGAAGEVMCPECGVVNIPTAPLAARIKTLQRRRIHLRLWVYGWLAAFGIIVVLIVVLWQ